MSKTINPDQLQIPLDMVIKFYLLPNNYYMSISVEKFKNMVLPMVEKEIKKCQKST